MEDVFDEVGFVFLFAPLHHDSMKYVMPVRQKIAKKTIFNLLGPHTNPCGAKRQIIGVYDQSLVETFSSVAKHLDMNRVLIVHGEDGLDEITITGKTFVSELKNNEINNYVISPKDFGLSIRNFEEIAKKLKNQGALEIVKGPKDIQEVFSKLISDKRELNKRKKASRLVYEENRGAVDRILNDLDNPLQMLLS